MLRARLIDYFRAGFYCHLTPGLNKMAEAALEAFPAVAEGSTRLSLCGAER